MQIRWKILPVLSLGLTLVAGCAVTPTVQEVLPIEEDLSRYSALEVVVDAPEHIRKEHGYAVTAAELQKEFIANVVASGKFATVGIISQSPKSLEARLAIKDFNYVSGASRGLVGVFGGRAVLNVTMTLKDREKEMVVGTFVAGDSSSYGQGVFGAVTSTQISAIAKELSSKLSGR